MMPRLSSLFSRWRKLRIFHIGGYWRGDNDWVKQIMLALSDAGAVVHEFSTDEHRDAVETDGIPYDRGTSGPVWIKWPQLEEPIRRFAPDIVFCNAGGLSFRPEVASTVRERYLLVGAALSDPGVFEPATRHICSNFDVFFTNDPGTVPKYRALGAPVELLPLSTNTSIWHPVAPMPEFACDVVMLGRGHPYRVEAVRALVERFDTHVYGEDWDLYGIPSRGFALGDDALTALSSAKMTIVFLKNMAENEVVKIQLFDFAAAGALVLTDRWHGVEPYFEYGKHLVGFGTTDELIEKVRYYLDHPAEAAAIRRAGREHTLRHHSLSAVWRQLLPGLAAKARTRRRPGS